MTGSAKNDSVSFLKNALMLSSGTFVIYMIQFLFAPVISRLFTPEAFGIAALFSTVSTLIWPFLSLKYQIAIVLPKEDREAANLFSLSTILLIGTMALITLVLFTFGEPIFAVFNISEMTAFIWLLALSMFVQGLSQPVRYWNIRKKYFKYMVAASVSNSVGNTILKILGGFAGYTRGGYLILVELIGKSLFTIIASLKLISNDLGFIISNTSFSTMMTQAKIYKDFPTFQNISSILNTASREMPTILMASFFGVAFLGQYSRASLLVQLPITLIATSISDVFLQAASERKSSGDNLTEFTFAFIKRVMTFGIAPFVFIFIIAPEFFVVFLGDQWGEAGLIARILSPWLLTILISSPLGNLILVFDKLRFWSLFNAVVFCARISVILIGGLIIKDAIFTIIMFSAVGVLCWLLAIRYVLRLVSLNLTRVLREFFLHLIFCIPIVFLVSVIKLTIKNPYITVIVGAIILTSHLTYFALKDKVVLGFIQEKVPAKWITLIQRVMRIDP